MQKRDPRSQPRRARLPPSVNQSGSLLPPHQCRALYLFVATPPIARTIALPPPSIFSYVSECLQSAAPVSLSLSVFAITIFLAPLSKPPSGRTAALLPQNTPPRPCDQRANQAAMAKALAGPCIQGPLPLSPTASLQPQLAVSSPSPLSTIILNLKPPCPPAPTALRYFALHERGCASAAVWPSLPVPPPAFSFPFSSSPFSSPSHISLRLWAAFLFLCACACACACV